jgi:hypothetical protein
MVLNVENLSHRTKIWEKMADFDTPFDESDKEFLAEEGFTDARTSAVGCMGWIWCQWLEGEINKAAISARVERLVERGMEMQSATPLFYFRPMHDLYLLHCAIFCSTELQLKQLAERVVDSSGYQKYTPQNNGELYASAWSGMLKYYILDDRTKAAEQAGVIWNAYRPPYFRAAAKSLVDPWLKDDYKNFLKAQKSDFEKLWVRSQKDGTIKSKTRDETVVDIQRVSSLEQLWCWAHCGLALLAFRKGKEVVNDLFWFPSYAQKCVDRN